jgi:hypothetical protein
MSIKVRGFDVVEVHCKECDSSLGYFNVLRVSSQSDAFVELEGICVSCAEYPTNPHERAVRRLNNEQVRRFWVDGLVFGGGE